MQRLAADRLADRPQRQGEILDRLATAAGSRHRHEPWRPGRNRLDEASSMSARKSRFLFQPPHDAEIDHLDGTVASRPSCCRDAGRRGNSRRGRPAWLKKIAAALASTSSTSGPAVRIAAPSSIGMPTRRSWVITRRWVRRQSIPARDSWRRRRSSGGAPAGSRFQAQIHFDMDGRGERLHHFDRFQALEARLGALDDSAIQSSRSISSAKACSIPVAAPSRRRGGPSGKSRPAWSPRNAPG